LAQKEATIRQQNQRKKNIRHSLGSAKGKKEENQAARESSPIKEILKGAKPSRKALIMKRDYCGKY